VVGSPFISLVTPTYRRPAGLKACMDSVASQTAVASIQHLIIPDYVGLGIGGMFATVPAMIAPAVQGRYVHLLADDDMLATPTVVAQVEAFADSHGNPPLILVRAVKGGYEWPQGQVWPPVMGQIDLGCFITRGDVWKAHCDRYGHVYEGDWHYGNALHESGIGATVCDVRFLIGGVNQGRPEVAA
jgi:hypothetical protein